MEKIYNNLSIENLIKTEWFNQFNKNQQKEILQGLKENIDISIYAKQEFDWEQMQEIRKGLKDNLDVSIYAKNDFNNCQMEQIRLGLEENIDVSIYANPNISGYEMEEIRKKTGKEINVILGEKMEELNKAKKESDWEKVEELIIEIKNLSVL